MGIAIYIELDRDVTFETFVDGKSIAYAFDELSSFSKENDLQCIEDFIYQDMSEFTDEFEEIDMDIPEQMKQWYDAQEGISWVKEILETLEAKSPKFTTEDLRDDFRCYLEIFENAKKVGAKWHLAVDI